MRFVRAVAITAACALVAALALIPRFGQQRGPADIAAPELASTLSVPYTFSSGGVIYASQLNANFQAIRTVVNALDDQNVANASLTGSLKLVDASVPLAKMAPDSVDSSKLVDASIATADLANSAVTTAKIADANVTLAKMAASSVGSSNIVDASIANADIADSTIAEVKLDINSAPTSGWLLFWNQAAGKLDYKAGTCNPVAIGGTSPASGSTVYFSGNGLSDASGDPVIFEVPAAGVVSSFRVKSQAAMNSGAGTAFTLRKAGVDTAMTCTVAAAGTACTYSATTISFAAGDALTVKLVAAGGTPAAKAFTVSMCFN